MTTRPITLENYGTLSVGTAATPLLVDGPKLLHNNGSQTIFVGSTPAVTMADGYPLPQGASLYVDNVKVYFIVATGTADLRYIQAK